MRGHWESTTRKFNKHYQSGAPRTPLEWWTGIVIGGFGLNGSGGDTYGLTFRSTGCYPGNAMYGGTMIIPAKQHGNSTFTSFVPFQIIYTDAIRLNTFALPDLLQYTLTDSTGKLKVIKTNITFTWLDVNNNSHSMAKSCYVFGYELADMPTVRGGFDNVQISNACFTDLKWHLSYNSPVLCDVIASGYTLEAQDSNLNTIVTEGSITYQKELTDETNGFKAPSVGSNVNADNIVDTVETESFNMRNTPFGACLFGYDDPNAGFVRLVDMLAPQGYNGTADYDNIIGIIQSTATSTARATCAEFDVDYNYLTNVQYWYRGDTIGNTFNQFTVTQIN